MRWMVADRGHDPLTVPHVELERLTFRSARYPIRVTLHGTVTFKNCIFEELLQFAIASHVNYYEPETKHILETNPAAYAENHKIEFSGCTCNNTLVVVFKGNVRKLLLTETVIHGLVVASTSYVDEMESSCMPTLSYIVVQLDRCEIYKHLYVDPKQIPHLKCPTMIKNVILEDSTFRVGSKGLVILDYIEAIQLHKNRFIMSQLKVTVGTQAEIHDCQFQASDIRVYAQYEADRLKDSVRRAISITNTEFTNCNVEIAFVTIDVQIAKCTFNGIIGPDMKKTQLHVGVYKTGKEFSVSVVSSKFAQMTVTIAFCSNLKVASCHFENSNLRISEMDTTFRGIVKRNAKQNDELNLLTTTAEIFDTFFYGLGLKITNVLFASVKECIFDTGYLVSGGYRETFATNLEIVDSLFFDTPDAEQSNKNEDCIAEKEDSMVTVEQVKLKVLRTTFRMNCIVPRGFIEWKKIFKKNIVDRSEISLIDSEFDASLINPTVPLVTVPFGFNSKLSMKNITLKCSYNIGYDWLDVRSLLQCKSYCEAGQYKVNSTEPAVALIKEASNKVEGLKSPACPDCPVGASCEKESILPLPNYWGFMDSSGEVQMMRCPKDYCCTGHESCQEVHSCAANRTGILCAKCKEDTTESLFSPHCVSIVNCQTSLVSAAYIFAAMVYAVFLLIFNDVKEKVKSLSKHFKCKKPKFLQEDKKALGMLLREDERIDSTRKRLEVLDSIIVRSYFLAGRATSSEPSTSKADQELMPQGDDSLDQNISVDEKGSNDLESLRSDSYKEDKAKEADSGMKYLQILFYYVQDATLFKVHLPVIGSSPESWIIHFLQFSPDVLLVYTSITNMCFMENTTPTIKVLFKALFGPFVMFLLLLVYIFAKLYSKVVDNEKRLENLKPRLCQAFILVVLLSYQKIMQGAFSLVRCVQYKDVKVLHIDAEVVCFTPWQTAIEIFLGTCVIPVFMVLAFGPYGVKKRKLSVVVFIMACILPLPVAFCLIIFKICDLEFLLGIKNYNNGREDMHDDTEYDTENSHGSDRPEYSDSEKIITEHLLKHYKALKICGVPMTWLGFHKIYRMLLVWCHTYIMEPLPRLSAMSILTIFMTFFTIFVKPYKETKANAIAILSHAASICISVVNIVKSTLIVGDYHPNDLVKTMVMYFDWSEVVLLSYIPVAAVGFWLIYTVWKFSQSRDKDKDDVDDDKAI